MNRTELRDKMLVSGSLERLDPNDPDWKTAFELYKTETGDLEVSLSCRGCFNKVKKWLIR